MYGRRFSIGTVLWLMIIISLTLNIIIVVLSSINTAHINDLTSLFQNNNISNSNSFNASERRSEEVYPPNTKECCFAPDCKWDDNDDCEADIIIAGCGTAGAYMTSLMSGPVPNSKKRFSVICLEKGSYRNDDELVNKVFFNNTIFALFIPSTLAKYSFATLADGDPNLSNYRHIMDYGEMIGGSSNHDYTFLGRPSHKRVNQYELIGGPRWSFVNLTDIMNEYEKFVGSSSWPHGNNGLMTVTQIDTGITNGFFNFDIMQKVIDASQGDNNGTTLIVDDYNGDYNTSFSKIIQYFWKFVSPAGTIERQSSALNYLNMSIMGSDGYGRNGRKMRVVPNTFINKINFDKNNHAISVDSIINGRRKRFYAKKQIIISSNTINTPAILERSGVGNSAILEPLGIPVIHHLPEVGENLQVHLGSQVIIATNSSMDIGNFISSVAHLSILPELRGTRAMQIFMLPGSGIGISPALTYNLGLSSLPPGFNAATFLFSMTSPKSRGSIHINTREPSQNPTINLNSYTDQYNLDFKLVNETFYVINNAVKQLQLDNPNYSYRMVYPPPEAFLPGSNDISRIIRDLPFIQAHFSSTCSMGTVLDGNLKLNGVTGVTVADTSSMPFISDSNTRTQAMFTAGQAAKYLLATLNPTN